MASSQNLATRGKKSELSEEGRVALALRDLLTLPWVHKRSQEIYKRFTRDSREDPYGVSLELAKSSEHVRGIPHLREHACRSSLAMGVPFL